MKRLLIAACLLLGLGLSSCQCSDKPPIGPVEGWDSSVLEGAAAPAPPPVV